jgi:hypothetical protein
MWIFTVVHYNISPVFTTKKTHTSLLENKIIMQATPKSLRKTEKHVFNIQKSRKSSKTVVAKLLIFYSFATNQVI